MDCMTNRELCRALVKAESESEAVQVLRDAGLWSDLDCWIPLGGIDNNYGTIINQQASAEAALAEKITNSIDARLMADTTWAARGPFDSAAAMGFNSSFRDATRHSGKTLSGDSRCSANFPRPKTSATPTGPIWLLRRMAEMERRRVRYSGLRPTE